MKAGFHFVGLALFICLVGSPSRAQGDAALPERNQEAKVIAPQFPKEKVQHPSATNSEVKDPCVASRATESKEFFEGDDRFLSNSQLQPSEIAKPVLSSEDRSRTENKPSLIAGWDSHRPFLRREGGFEIFLNGYIQADWHGTLGGPRNLQTFLVRRARLGVDGKFRPNLDFKLQFDFSNPKLITLKDAYIKLHLPHKFQLSIGHMKAPLGQEELNSDSAGDFVENSLLSNLTTYRSPGIILSGESGEGRLEYQVGVFNGVQKFTRAKEESPEAFVRLRFSPWRNSGASQLKKLTFGGALAKSLADGPGESVRGRSETRDFTFYKPERINGTVTRANAELVWLSGPSAFRTEYDQTNQERAGLGPNGENLPGVVARGYMAQFTYLLTGETKVDSRNVAPKHNFMEKEDGSRGFGAWELKLRYSNLQINDSTAKSNRADSLYFGLNWYLNQHLRYVLDFGHQRFKDPLRTPNVGEGHLFVVLSRIQLAF
jgi:phosphate-selective porin OprO and OprP